VSVSRKRGQPVVGAFSRVLHCPPGREVVRPRSSRDNRVRSSMQLTPNKRSKRRSVQGISPTHLEDESQDSIQTSTGIHHSNGAPVYPKRKLSIRWDPSSAARSGSAPLSWQAWIVSETALETSGGTRGSHLAVGNITSLNNFIGALLYPPSVVPFSKADFRGVI
jgi:hypothetical protein